MTKFTSIDDAIEFEGLTLTARIVADDGMGEPWKEHDGHGPVSDWTTRDKAPGELILSNDGHRKRFYDFAEACRIARRDGWGAPAYSLDIEKGANGLCQASAHWFKGRELCAYRSAWCDDVNDAIADVYEQHRATMSPREYAAYAARSDFERMRSWCDDGWQWVGVVVTASKAGVKLGDASLWGIESDAGQYLVDVANELAEQAADEARATLATLAA